MRFPIFRSRSLFWLAGLLAALLSARTVHAQRLEDGERAFEENARKTRFLRADLFKGVTRGNPKEKDHLEAAEIAAKEVTYPLYWNTVGPQPPAAGKINRQVAEFESRLSQMSKFKASTETFQQMYCRQVAERAQEVVLRGKPIAAVSAARILAAIPERRVERGVLQSEKTWVDEVMPRLVEGNAEYMAQGMLSILENPRTNDGVRYYLLRGLANLMGLPRQNPPLLKKETEEKAVQIAVKMVEKKGIFPRSTPRGEVEGFKILRREAVKVLAQSPAPVVGKDRPALLLAKVAGNDQDLVPSPRLEERLEAAIGLARLAAAAAKFPDLQPDYAAYQIARCVAEFGDQADRNRDSKTIGRLRPWKIDAARMLEPLDLLKAVKSPFTQDVVKQCEAVLSLIERGSQGGGNALADWVSRNEPPVKSLFKSDPESTVKPAVEKE